MENIFDSNQDIQTIKIEDSIKASYLDYSMSVIIGRALPDARDGLKPVHRRILYAMNDLSISSRSPYKKCARIVGDVIGKYHPHGDTAVYDALVRMAQPFAMRIPSVDGQGNFGSIDGDNAAAMRYTEARMTTLSEELLRDIDKDTVDFTPNYDDSMVEPDVLPSRVPNLLLNGSSGIAVGMATNIPPHCLDELIPGLLAMIENPEITLEEMMEFIKGPDFPTKGIIFGKKGILDAYSTGRGRIKIRAKIHMEKKGSKDIIIIDELPYQVNKSRLIEQIANLVKEKQVEGISELRDESDREGIRVVIELKRDAMSEIVLNNLYKSTNLEVTFGVILLAIENKEPKVFKLLELLQLFLNHRKTVIIRRTIYELEKAKAKAHILEGLKIALDNIDAIIELIKGSSDTSSAKAGLVEKFGLSEVQASAILDMKLNRLTGLEREKIENELKALHAEIERLSAILKSETLLSNIIKEELIEIQEKFKSPRVTEIEDDYDDIDMEDLIPNEPAVVTITHRGYIKRVPLKSYEKQKRGGKGKTAVTVYDDDFIERFFTPTTDFSEDKSLVFFTKNGVVKRTNLGEFSNIRSNGVKAINLDDDDSIITAKIADQDVKQLFMITKLSQCIKFDIEKTRDQGRNTRGVRGIKFKLEGDEVVDANIICSDEQEILVMSEKGIGKRTEAGEYRLTNRGGSGVIAMKMTAKTGKNVVGCLMVDETMDMMALTVAGKMIRVDMQTIRKAGRNTSGVIVVNVSGKDIVKSIARCPKEEKVEDEIVPESDAGLIEE